MKLNIIPLNQVSNLTLGVLRVYFEQALKAETLRYTSKTISLDDPMKGFKLFMKASEIDISGRNCLGPNWVKVCDAVKN